MGSRQNVAWIPSAFTDRLFKVKDRLCAGGLGWGLAGGLVATLIMDLILMGGFIAVGLPALTCFTIVGDTMERIFLILGAHLAGGVPLGAATHYLVGPLMGAIFGAGMVSLKALKINTLKKSILCAILYVEIVSQPILATTPILMKYTAPDTLQWFSASFGMHFLWGGVLGAVVYLGLAHRFLEIRASGPKNLFP